VVNRRSVTTTSEATKAEWPSPTAFAKAGPLFLADGTIYKKPVAEVQKRVATLTGANELSVSRIATTFVKLCEIADWSGSGAVEQEQKRDPGGDADDAADAADSGRGNSTGSGAAGDGASIRLHHDIHIHLPATSDPTVYRAVFQAIKAELT
jgi:hypothetical protein